MANEIQVTGTLVYTNTPNGIAAEQLAILNKLLTITGKNFTKGSLLVATTPGTAIPVGGLTTPSWMFIINQDPTHFVTILPGTGVAALLKLMPGEFCMGRFASAAPFAVADVAACVIEYFVLDN